MAVSIQLGICFAILEMKMRVNVARVYRSDPPDVAVGVIVAVCAWRIHLDFVLFRTRRHIVRFAYEDLPDAGLVSRMLSHLWPE